jgi:hypothetical protein
MDPRQPIEFEPVALARRRRVDPLVLGVIAVALGIAAAVLKPWDLATPAADPARLGAAPSLGPTRTDGPARSAPSGSTKPATPAPVMEIPLTWDEIATIGQPHDAWGVRVIVRASSQASGGTLLSLDERWSPISSTGVSAPRVVVQPGDREIVGLGLTFPEGRTPLDVRFWRRSSTGALYWLDSRPVARDLARGGAVFVPPTTDPGSPTWGAGEYRIDALIADGTIERFELDIPDRYDNVRPSSIDPPAPSELVASSLVDPSSIPVGPFATIDRVGWSLASTGGVPLDEAGAWLDTAAGSGRAPTDRVAVAHLPRATGLGVRLPDGSLVRAASLTRLAPEPFASGPTRIGGGIIDRRNEDPWVVFPARGGGAFAAGTYRIDVTWSDGSRLRQSAWHVELVPGPVPTVPPLLGMAP